MLHKFNTFARILIVILLVVPVYPIEPALAVEVTETEERAPSPFSLLHPSRQGAKCVEMGDSKKDSLPSGEENPSNHSKLMYKDVLLSNV